MAIRIILEKNKATKHFKEVSMDGNEEFLFQEGYPLLGSLDDVSYDVFGPDQMCELIKEIEKVRSNNLNNQPVLKHLDEIITLAKECLTNRSLVLTFTPFSKSDEQTIALTNRFNQYDVVKITKVLKKLSSDSNSSDDRLPQIGDTAAILEVYDNPFGYELECSGSDGKTKWLGGYSPEQLELELVTPALPLDENNEYRILKTNSPEWYNRPIDEKIEEKLVELEKWGQTNEFRITQFKKHLTGEELVTVRNSDGALFSGGTYSAYAIRLLLNLKKTLESSEEKSAELEKSLHCCELLLEIWRLALEKHNNKLPGGAEKYNLSSGLWDDGSTPMNPIKLKPEKILQHLDDCWGTETLQVDVSLDYEKPRKIENEPWIPKVSENSLSFQENLDVTIKAWTSEHIEDEWLFEKFRQDHVLSLTREDAHSEIQPTLTKLIEQKKENQAIEVLEVLISLARQSETTEIPSNLRDSLSDLQSNFKAFGEYANEKLGEFFRHFRLFGP